MTRIYSDAQCTVTINGEPLRAFNVEFSPLYSDTPKPIAQAECSGTFTIRPSLGELDRLVDSMAPSRYWRKRWQFRRRQARKNWWRNLFCEVTP